MYGVKAMTPQELKYESPRSDPSIVPYVDELATKDLLDGDRVQALNALNKYQAATKRWMDKAIVFKEFPEEISSLKEQHKRSQRAHLKQNGKAHS